MLPTWKCLEGKVKLEMVLRQLAVTEKPTTGHDSLDKGWLEELSSLNENSLCIILNELNYSKLISTYPKDKPPILKHIQSCLLPETFFNIKNVDISREIRQELFSLLSLDQICDILVNDPAYKTLCVLIITNTRQVVEKIGDLVVNLYRDKVLEILSQNRWLNNLRMRLSSYFFDDYKSLHKAISRLLNDEDKLWSILTKHSFFTQYRLSKIQSSDLTDRQIGNIILEEMKKQLSIPYRYLLKFLTCFLSLYLQSHDVLLQEDPNTWIDFLDKFMVWLIVQKGYTLKKLVWDVFGSQVECINDDQPFNTWEDVVAEFFKVEKPQFPSPDSIQTFQQFIVIRYLNSYHKLGEEDVQTVCKIIGQYVKDEEFDVKWGANSNMAIGMRKVMADLIEKWPHLDSLLQKIFSEPAYWTCFLKVLSKWDEWVFKDLTILNQFMGQLKEAGIRAQLVINILGEMHFSNSVKGGIKEIETVEMLFEWIDEAKDKDRQGQK